MSSSQGSARARSARARCASSPVAATRSERRARPRWTASRRFATVARASGEKSTSVRRAPTARARAEIAALCAGAAGVPSSIGWPASSRAAWRSARAAPCPRAGSARGGAGSPGVGPTVVQVSGGGVRFEDELDRILSGASARAAPASKAGMSAWVSRWIGPMCAEAREAPELVGAQAAPVAARDEHTAGERERSVRPRAGP